MTMKKNSRIKGMFGLLSGELVGDMILNAQAPTVHRYIVCDALPTLPFMIRVSLVISSYTQLPIQALNVGTSVMYALGIITKVVCEELSITVTFDGYGNKVLDR